MTAAQEAFDEAMGGIQLKKRMAVQKEALGSGVTLPISETTETEEGGRGATNQNLSGSWSSVSVANPAVV